MVDVYVALGSNVSPEEYLRRALIELHKQYAPLRISPAYRNRAMGFEGADFINLVVGFSTDDAPERVRERLQEIEAACDRQPNAAKWASRTMDIDILLYDNLQSTQPGLVIPRPDLVRRAYMLKPLVDIAPDLVHPTLKKSMRELWAEFDQGAHELVELEDWGLEAGGWR
jgi:2-amino-4-hydroxy-6-hydroxymethyldihydropteridine diphosphokinase